ncbi:fucolectin-6-like [Haliotis asinina]|uniref:fucolectin-6-like n=1 Tax=Haliotis asinina TaxID=109174 RepID=UPI003531E9C3
MFGEMVSGEGIFLSLYLACLQHFTASCVQVQFSLTGSPTGEVFYGHLLDRMMTQTVLDCARKCAGAQGCAGYRFYHANGTCDMTSMLTEAAAVTEQGFSSYRRHMEAYNVALSKSASLSSTVYPQYTAPKALSGGCAWTAYSTDPWWKVDLGQPYKIHTVQVTSSEHCCNNDPIAIMEVALGNGCWPLASCPDKCSKTSGLIEANSVQEFSCLGLFGSYQYVELRASGGSIRLRVCDVKVMGH